MPYIQNTYETATIDNYSQAAVALPAPGPGPSDVAVPHAQARDRITIAALIAYRQPVFWRQ